MAAGFEVRGGRDLARISRELRAVAGGKEIRKQLAKEIRSAAKPLVPAVRASIGAIPVKGTARRSKKAAAQPGLRQAMKSAVKLTVKTSGKQAGVAIRVDGRKMPSGQGALPSYMEGTRKPWRHPVFGNREAWVAQKPKPYFYKVVRPFGLKSRVAINKAMDKVSREVL